MQNNFSDFRWLEDLRRGDCLTLAKTLSLIESQGAQNRQRALKILQALTQTQTKSVRLGITGAMGVGKSSLIRALGAQMLAQGKVAVLAVDPSSPRSGGSVLGDKIRMLGFADKQDVYVRPLPSSVATARLAEMVRVCEFAGYRHVIVETVGVGQTDYRVRDLVDVLVMLVVANTGDMIQCMKKGLSELTDIFVVNKCDGEGKEQAKQLSAKMQSVLHLSASAQKGVGGTPVVLVSATEGSGISDLYAKISALTADKKQAKLQATRAKQELRLFRVELHRLLIAKLSDVPAQINDSVKEIRAGRLSATVAAERLMSRLKLSDATLVEARDNL